MSSPDPYGTDLAISPNGDLVVTASGDLAAVSGPYNCAQAIFLRFKTFPGEIALHPQFGSTLAADDIGRKLNAGGLALQASADLQNLVAQDPRFRAATIGQVLSPGSADYPGSITIQVNATLQGGETLTLADVTDPSPSDVTLPQAVDPSIDPTLTYDPTAEQEFFADQPELDSLNDLNTLQALVDDVPGASILGG